MKAFLASIALIAMTLPALAQEPDCYSAANLFNELKRANVTADRIETTNDLEFIKAYHAALGIEIPPTFDPARFIMVKATEDQMFLALVAINGCIINAGPLSVEKHDAAYKAAAAGV